MTDNQKVYIRGVDGRGDEVIAALVNLGAKTDLFGGLGDNPDRIYYIKHNGHISFTGIDTETGKIIVDHYQEIKLPKPKPKPWEDGDILTRKDNNNLFCVYQRLVDTYNGKGILCHVYVSKDTLFTGVTIPLEAADNYRKITDAEKSTFYSLIDNHHMRWDAEKKELVEWRWKPKMGDIYFYLGNFIDVRDTEWMNTNGDKMLYEAGNCFRTREEAETMVEKFKKLLKGEQL